MVIFPSLNLTNISGLEATRPKLSKFKLTRKGEGFNLRRDRYNDLAGNKYSQLNL